MKRIIQSLTTPKGYIACFTIAVLIAATLAYMYISSFKNVTFVFDSSKGSINLIDSEKKTYSPISNTEIRLKKGEYTLMKKGADIAQDSRVITINDDSNKISVDFNYTEQYLKTLYEKQQIDIYATILKKYPTIKSDYTINGGQLYNQGEWFGATLTYNNRQSAHRDTLRILLNKQNDTWQVVSKPPTPILSKQQFPNAPYETLKAINQVR